MKICLDHGHDAINPDTGWYDPGCVWGSLTEAGVAKMICALVAKKLKSTIPTYIPTTSWNTADRAKSAIAAGCDYYLCIHINSSTNTQAEGVSGYYNPAGRWFANDMVFNLASFIGMNNLGAHYSTTLKYPDGSDRAPALFDILYHKNIPTVMLELGFISNEKDRTLYATQNEFLADAIITTLFKFAGITMTYFRKDKSYSETNGKTKKLLVPPTELNNRIMLGIRDVAEMMDLPVLYHPIQKEVVIIKK